MISFKSFRILVEGRGRGGAQGALSPRSRVIGSQKLAAEALRTAKFEGRKKSKTAGDGIPGLME